MRMYSGNGTRRDFLAGTAAICGTAFTISPANAGLNRLDLGTPSGRLKAYMMMRGALDERLIVGFVNARYYGVVDDEIKPLFGVVAATFARYRAMPDGGYESVGFEVPYFTDLETGQALNQWLNPYSGEHVTVSDTAYPPAKLIITPNLNLTVPKPPPGMTIASRVLPPQMAENDLWMTEESTSSFQFPGQKKPARYGELVTLHARLSDLDSPHIARVPCQTAYTSVSSWRSWMKMGDLPGHLMANGAGRYDIPINALPTAWHEAVQARRPTLLHDPGAPITTIWTVAK